MVAIRDMRFRLELIGLVRADDGYGGAETTGAVDDTVDAAIRPASTREIEAAGRREQRISHVIVIRFRPDVAAAEGMRVRWTDRAGRIRQARIATVIDPDEGGRFLRLDAEEGGPV